MPAELLSRVIITSKLLDIPHQVPLRNWLVEQVQTESGCPVRFTATESTVAEAELLKLISK
jgi:hypothetical protein